MVKLEQLNKYFNKNKKNEIHVIDNTSLEFNETGIVSLLGPSGCGKTTLLNVIGGLDKVNKGNVYINGQKMTGRRTGKIDEIRNLNIGYIFQNYNLVETMTVFDNVAMVLKMIGMKDKEEIAEKVNYALELVGMYRYRNRYADMLSGGERQRVGIARAIAKNPAIIIADEPTGNLDSKNTLEVMNIIKAISEKKLVILVTHEEKLADFYSDRIIRIRDGVVVSDQANENRNDLDYRQENKIYLKDIEKHERLTTEDYDIRLYDETGSKVSLDIVVKNGNIYFKSRSEGDRLEVIDENSSIEFIDDHYRKMSKEEYEKHRFDPEKLRPANPPKNSSIVNPITMITGGFKKVANYHILKKLLLVGFFVSAMFIIYAISNIFGVTNIQDAKFVTENKDNLQIVGKNIKVEDYLAYEQDPTVDYVLPGNSKVSFDIKYKDYLQTSQNSESISGSLSAIDTLTQGDLVAGTLPTSDREIVIDQSTVKGLIAEGAAKSAGLVEAKDFIGKQVTVANMAPFTIVGITDKASPCIYTARTQFINIIAGSVSGGEGGGGGAKSAGAAATPSAEVIDVALKQDSITLKKGTMPNNDYEVLVNIKNEESMPLNKEIKDKVNDKKLKVVGYYYDKYDSDYKLVNHDTVKYNTIVTKENVTIYPKDKAAAIESFQNKKINVVDTYEVARAKYVKNSWPSMLSAIILAGVILAISFIEIYLIIRASFLSRVKEIGVYRAIGVRKMDIYKMFLGEILAITTLAGLPGYLFMAYILEQLTHISYTKDMYMMNFPILLLGFVVIYAFNIFFGMFPVWKTLQKTPAAILSRTDVD
ncbi:MAG: ABC transporter ATP-binding protein/permease [Anaerovoracaceae bacterium]